MNPDSSHPKHECPNCGKTHMSYADRMEFIKKNKKTRNILLAIVCISFVSIPIGLTVFDYVKDPWSLDSNIDYSLFEKGYDVLCYSDLGMQRCILQGNESNHLAYNEENIVIQAKSNPCLNVNLATDDKITDKFMVEGGVDCIASLEFPVIDGWHYKMMGVVPSPPETDYFYAEKVKYWWNDWWLDL